MPGVVAAIRLEVDVGVERHLADVDLEDRLAAGAVGRLDGHAAVEAPRPQQRLVEHVRPVRRADHDDADGRVEAVHLGEDLVKRLLALVVAAAEAAGARSARAADGVELVDEDDRRAASFACSNRSRTREAPTPTIASTNSEAAIEKNGTFASPATARASSVLPGARAALQQDAVRDAGAQPPVLLRFAEEVDDLRQLGLRLVDPGHVGEGHLLAAGLVALCLRAAEVAEHVLRAPGAAQEQEEQARGRAASGRSRRAGSPRTARPCRAAPR